mgnify:CR=1 FL=1
MHSALEIRAVVMAGGAGTRFWPLSRKRRPKQLLALFGERSLLQEAVARVVPLCGWEGVWVVTGEDTASAVAAQLPELPGQQLLVEPVRRDTAACVGWMAWRVLARGENPVLVVLPADHWVGDEEAFRRVIQVAAGLASQGEYLVTVGITPTRPETGYGYLEIAEEIGTPEGIRCFRLRRFVEKPNLETARSFVACGRYRWNAGIFVFTAAAVASAVRTYLPELASGLDALMADAKLTGEQAALAKHYPGLVRVSLDFGVMEKASNILAVDGAFPWHDVGSFAALAQLLPKQEAGVALGSCLSLDTKDSVLLSYGPLVATVGVEGLVVVATPDAVLVTTVEQAQRVKELVELMQRKGMEQLL